MQTHPWGFPLVWSSGFSSGRTSLQERGEIRPGCYFRLLARPSPGANDVEQIPEGQQEVRYQPKGAAALGPGYDMKADKFFARKAAGGPELERAALHAALDSPDGYHSAKEHSDFDDDTEEETQEVESEGEPMEESDNSDTSSVRSGRASLHSQRSTTANGDRKRTSRKLKATHSNRAMNAKKGIKGKTPNGKKSRVVLSMFRDSQKEGALEYADWRAEVEEYIKKGYEDNKIKDAMLFSLEGKAHWNFQHCDEYGDLTPAEILKWMDMSYNASVDFRDLNARLCGLKQGPFEAPKDYYDHMVDIGVALREYHQDHFQPGELSHIEKECFFAGLRDQSKYLVSHMKDKKEYGLVDMLKELRRMTKPVIQLIPLTIPEKQMVTARMPAIRTGREWVS